MNFSAFQLAVSAQWAAMTQGEVYVTNITKEQMWETYLSALAPDDTMFKTRTEHNCSTCRHFIRDVGNLVTINADGTLSTIWDVSIPDEPAYQRAADALSALVKSGSITNAFLTSEAAAGCAATRGMLDGYVHTYHHFHVEIPRKFRRLKSEIGSAQNDARTNGELLVRALTELTPGSVSEVLELIASNSIYRGQEFKGLLTTFQTLQANFKASGLSAQLFAWRNMHSTAARIKNTAIGTLLSDISEGCDLDEAVKSFERKVAPENYKRPTALVTPKMIESAKEKVAELGLLDSLHRRYANLTDISVNNVLFADRSARGGMKGGDLDVFAALETGGRSMSPKSFDRADRIGIDKFLSDVVPTAETIEVFFEGRHSRNLVSVVTGAVENSANLFKWDNPFSWSYSGDLADAIKERVKAAGGNVTGDVCCRLAWNNYDDLDFHLVERTQRHYEIYFGTRGSTSPNGGRLDVDANAGHGQTRTPVENIFYQSASKMQDGEYHIFVHQYNRREPSINPTFTVEIDVLGDIHTFHGANPAGGKQVDIAKIVKKNGEITVKPLMDFTSSSVTRTEWSISSNQFHRVNAMMFSPNHWEGEKGVGNKHVFFLLDGCVNDGNARGFYNEFLNGALDPHRKVLELIGSRQRTDETENQLSGLGFSLTKKDELIVRVTGATKRVFRVTF